MPNPPTPQDALYAWMVPYYAMVARTNASVLLTNQDNQWQAIKAKIEEHSGHAHADLLAHLFSTGKTHDAVAALERLWSPLAR